MGLSLEIQNKTNFKISKKIFLEILNHLKKNIKISGDISLVLVGEREIHELNKNYRHKDKVTDVLSFPTFEGEKVPGGVLGELGDIFICPAVIKKNFGREYGKRLRHLFLHGTLHLLGYDHQNDREAEKMEKLEQKVLKYAQ